MSEKSKEAYRLPIERPFGLGGERSDYGISADLEARLPTERNLRRIVLPLSDLIAFTSVLAIVLPLPATSTEVESDRVLLPVLVLAVSGALGVYGGRSTQHTRGLRGDRSSLLGPRGPDRCLPGTGVHRDPHDVSVAGSRLIGRGRRERWMPAGNEDRAERPARFRPSSRHAQFVCAVVPPRDPTMKGARYRNGALALANRYRAGSCGDPE